MNAICLTRMSCRVLDIQFYPRIEKKYQTKSISFVIFIRDDSTKYKMNTKVKLIVFKYDLVLAKEKKNAL